MLPSRYPVGPTPLSRLEQVFLQEEVDTELGPLEEGSPIECLRLDLGTDREGRSYWLRLFLLNDVSDSLGLTDQGDVVLASLTCELPFPTAPGADAEIARGLQALTARLPLGTYLHDEAARRLVLRHVLAFPNRSLNDRVMVETAGLLRAFLFDSLDTLEGLAAGRLSADEVRRSLQTGDT